MPQNNFRLILLACRLVLVLCDQYCVAICRGFGHKLGVNIETDMRQELFRHLQTQSFEYYDKSKDRQADQSFDYGSL